MQRADAGPSEGVVRGGLLPMTTFIHITTLAVYDIQLQVVGYIGMQLHFAWTTETLWHKFLQAIKDIMIFSFFLSFPISFFVFS